MSFSYFAQMRLSILRPYPVLGPFLVLVLWHHLMWGTHKSHWRVWLVSLSFPWIIISFLTSGSKTVGYHCRCACRFSLWLSLVIHWGCPRSKFFFVTVHGFWPGLWGSLSRLSFRSFEFRSFGVWIFLFAFFVLISIFWLISFAPAFLAFLWFSANLDFHKKNKKSPLFQIEICFRCSCFR